MENIEVSLTFSLDEYVALSETADLNNSGTTEWAKRTLLNATFTNDDARFGIRAQIKERIGRKYPARHGNEYRAVAGIAECDVCGTTEEVKALPTGDGWNILRCPAHQV